MEKKNSVLPGIQIKNSTITSTFDENIAFPVGSSSRRSQRAYKIRLVLLWICMLNVAEWIFFLSWKVWIFHNNSIAPITADGSISSAWQAASLLRLPNMN